MLTNHDLKLVRAALNRLVSLAQQGITTGQTVDDILKIINTHHEAAVALGTDWFLDQALELGISPQLRLHELDQDLAHTQLTKTVSTGGVLLAVDQLVKLGFRRTIQRSAHASGAAWAVVPKGKSSCAWCLMLASRGAVYRSKNTARSNATGSELFHGHCDCQTVLVRGPQDYPKGYNPDVLYQKYAQARDAAGSTKASDVVQQLRLQEGIK